MNYLERRRHMKLYGKAPDDKKKSGIANKSEKKIAEEQAAKESGSDEVMDRWFEDRRKEMTGECLFCGDDTENMNDYYRHSIAHLFAKRKNQFPSIKLHPENWIELCFFGNSCHTNFDNHTITFAGIKKDYPHAWEEIVRKTLILYTLMTQQEQNRIPDILLSEIKPMI